MKKYITSFLCLLFLVASATTSHAYKREKQYKDPILPPGVIHEAPCREVAPGVYNCGNQKNKNRSMNKKSGKWKVTFRPTEKVTVTAQSKAMREAKKNSKK